jgi:tetratricopeptide (TPR) repeat protein
MVPFTIQIGGTAQMVEQLIQLMEAGDYEGCLRAAEQVLLRGGLGIVEMAKVNLVIARCKLAANDAFGAIPSGIQATKMSRDAKEWDLFGRSLLTLGAAYVGANNFGEALEQFYTFIKHLADFNLSRRLEGAVWRQLGITYGRMLETEKAIDSLERARRWFARNENEHSQFICGSDLINVYLNRRQRDPEASLEPVRTILAEQKLFAKRMAHEPLYQTHYLYNHGEYYYYMGRTGRAMIMAMQSMELAPDDNAHRFQCHMLLHRCALRQGNGKHALGYAVAARLEAMRGRFYEMELLAVQAITETIRTEGSRVVEELEKDYHEVGLDLSDYLAPGLVKNLMQ